MIVVRALVHIDGVNPGEMFALSPERFEAEMKRAGPKRVAVVEVTQPPAAAPVVAPPAVDVVLEEPVEGENRERATKRRRG